MDTERNLQTAIVDANAQRNEAAYNKFVGQVKNIMENIESLSADISYQKKKLQEMKFEPIA